MGKTKISAVIIAKNEEDNLSECLKNLDFVDDIIYVDNDSTDKSLEIAKKFGSRIYSFIGGSFSERKNFAFNKVTDDWFISLDADERITPQLKNEIFEKITNYKLQITNFGAYAIPRKNIILGKVMKHGGWWPDYVIRLFKTENFRRMNGELHEQPEFNGKLGYLVNSITHNKHLSISEMVEKTNEWSEVEAKLMFDAHHPPMNVIRFASAGAREFWLRFVKHMGFLDGVEGIIYSLYQVFSRLVSYAKLWEMQLK